MRCVKLAALLTSLMIAVQLVVLPPDKEGLCLSQGCQVVDQLTRVSPLLFNVVGLFFFQAVFWVNRLKASPEIDSFLPGTENEEQGCSVNTDCGTVPSSPVLLTAYMEPFRDRLNGATS